MGQSPQRGRGRCPLKLKAERLLAKRQMTNLPYSLKALRVLMFTGTLYQRSRCTARHTLPERRIYTQLRSHAFSHVHTHVNSI